MSSLLSKLCLVISLSLSLSSINAQSFFTVLEKTLDDYSHLDLSYVNYMLSSDSRSSGYQIIQIQDPMLTATDGQISFAISDNSIPSQTLFSRKVKYDSEGEYRWTGTSIIGTFSVSINKGPNGISGNVITGIISGGVARYQILPLEGEEAVLVPVTPTIFTCELEHDSETISGAPSIVDIEACDDDNPGHVDILFLLDLSSAAILGNNASGHLNMLIAELEDAWTNSGITHTVDYTVDNYVPSSSFIYTDECIGTVRSFSNDSEAIRLRDLHNADIVVYLLAAGFSGDTKACVPEIGPYQPKAYVIMSLRESLDNYVFSHELGHLFGARHVYEKTIELDLGICNFAHELDFGSFTVGTILGGNDFTRILHYSDPDINYDGVPTGIFDLVGIDAEPMVTNNAGKIRSTGKEVSDFNGNGISTSNIKVEIEGGNECLLLTALGDNIPSPILFNWTNDHITTYDWFWCYDGLFTNGAGFNYFPLGSGTVLDVAEPVTDCRYYFIKLVVSSNFSTTHDFNLGPIVPIASSIVSIQGAKCANFECPTSGSSGSSFSIVPSNTNMELLNAVGYDGNRQKKNKIIQIFNVQGAYLGTVNAREEIFNMNLKTGIYLIRSEENQDYQTEKIFITNDN